MADSGSPPRQFDLGKTDLPALLFLTSCAANRGVASTTCPRYAVDVQLLDADGKPRKCDAQNHDQRQRLYADGWQGRTDPQQVPGHHRLTPSRQPALLLAACGKNGTEKNFSVFQFSGSEKDLAETSSLCFKSFFVILRLRG